MIPDAIATHEIAGRFRVRVNDRKNDEKYFASVASELKAMEGVQDVKANPSTGSILVLHRRSRLAISELAADRGLFRVIASPADNPPSLGACLEQALAGGIVENLLRGDPRFRGVTLGLLVGAGLYQAAKGAFLPAGLTLFAYALTVSSWSRNGPAGPVR
jgi:hypothetical protein